MARKIKMGKPKIRLPKEIKKGEIIEVRVKIRFASSTGLKVLDEEKQIFGRDKDAVYLNSMQVIYGGELITEYLMTSATSPDPLIRFKMRADKAAPLKIVFESSLGQRAEVTQNISF